MKLQIALVNHLLNQHPDIRHGLAAFAGRRIGIALVPASVQGVLTEEGWLAECEGEPEAFIKLNYSAALSSLRGREPALADVQLEGDTELGAAVGRLVARLSWDVTEDVSRVVGDVAAHRLELMVKRSLGLKGVIAWRLAENWLEHLREEAPMLASKHAVQGFVDKVDALRDDTARFEKRLSRLEAHINTKTLRDH